MRQISLPYSLIWHSYFLAAIIGVLCSVWVIPSLVCAVILLYMDRRLWTLPRFIIFISIFFLFFGFTKWRFYVFETEPTPEWTIYERSKKTVRICGEVIDSQGIPDNRLKITLSGMHPENQNSNEIAPGLCIWTLENPPIGFKPLPNQSVCITQKIKSISNFANFENDSFIISYYAKGIRWRLYSKADNGNPEIKGTPSWSSMLREKLLQKFLSILNTKNFSSIHDQTEYTENNIIQAKAILVALLFGDRQYLQQKTFDNFALATFAHSLALSGQHLCVAAFLAMFAVFILIRINRSFYLSIPKILLLFIVTWPLAMLYLWIGNAPPSLIRAACMLSFFGFFVLRGSIFTGLDILCATMLVILLHNPLSIFDISLQLSALCIAIISLFAPSLKLLFPANSFHKIAKWKIILKYIIQILSISMLIQIALLPLNLSTFSLAGLWFPLNIIWLPILAFIVLPLSAISLIITLVPFPFAQTISNYSLTLAALPCEYLVNILDLMKNNAILIEPAFMRPQWSSLIAFALITIACSYSWGTKFNQNIKNKITVLLLCSLGLLAIDPLSRFIKSYDNSITLEALDVGQGQAILIEAERNRILIDGGGNVSSRFDIGNKILAPYLKTNMPPKLAAIINTHPDMDHLYGLFYLLDKFDVDTLFHNGEEASGITFEKWKEYQRNIRDHILHSGDIIQIGAPEKDLHLEILYPPVNDTEYMVNKNQKSPKKNDKSLVIRLKRGKTGLALLMGDAEKEVIKDLLRKGVDLSSKIVIAPHHGSDRSFLAEFYQASQPEVVIACCGFQNRWNYPNKKLKTFLQQVGTPLLNTGENGKIRIVFDNKDKMEITTIKK